ncbi:hypothetical protein NIIDMKKI_39480 [Mycobacterium kansasii]|uniref:Acyl-CoA thioesterase II domain protein n=1 Tax=Mycobacterium kansasii TaxID=1768 RepID=A0A1V3WJD3_MYCKA|nr:acyl-CoA thioesterase II domain protein [Mycobacterium kansasii]BCI88742.1 hypothetical protein NIIDMKKI_39480 [Mycobacterium kansasii]
MSDFDELLAVLDLRRVADDRFIGSHPSKNPMRTFGGLLVAQSFVASTRTLTREELPPSALSVHFINGVTPPRTSNSMWCGCATSGGSPTGASTRYRTARCCLRR